METKEQTVERRARLICADNCADYLERTDCICEGDNWKRFAELSEAIAESDEAADMVLVDRGYIEHMPHSAYAVGLGDAPEGYVLMPREPTENMGAEGFRFLDNWRGCYEAMIVASEAKDDGN